MYSTIKGISSSGLHGIWSAPRNGYRLWSYRLLNKGSTTAYIALVLREGSTVFPITQHNIRIEPGDWAIEKDVNIDLPANNELMLQSDSTDIFYWVIFDI